MSTKPELDPIAVRDFARQIAVASFNDRCDFEYCRALASAYLQAEYAWLAAQAPTPPPQPAPEVQPSVDVAALRKLVDDVRGGKSFFISETMDLIDRAISGVAAQPAPTSEQAGLQCARVESPLESYICCYCSASAARDGDQCSAGLHGNHCRCWHLSDRTIAVRRVAP